MYWYNEYLKRWHFHRRQAATGPYPSVMQVELTNRCRMRCIMCPRTHGMSRAEGDMELPLFRRIAGQLAPYTRYFWLHGFGDPLLRNDLDEVFAVLAEHKLQAGISTNPVMLTEKKMALLLDGRLHTLVLSLDGMDRATFARMRGRDYYDESVARVEEFLERHRAQRGRPHTVLSIINMDATEAQCAAFRRKYRDLGADEIWIKPFVSWDGTMAEISELSAGHQDGTVQARKRLPCMEPWLKVAVLWDGRVVPCCYDYDGKYLLGDLRHQTLQQVWDGVPLQRLRADHVAGALGHGHLCRECTADSRAAPRRWYPLDVPLRCILRKLR